MDAPGASARDRGQEVLDREGGLLLSTGHMALLFLLNAGLEQMEPELLLVC